MRVLITSPYFLPNIGGIEQVIENHIKGLKTRNHTAGVLTTDLRYPTGRFNSFDFLYQSKDDVFRVKSLIRTPKIFGHPILSYPSESGLINIGVRRAIERFMPDIIHIHNIGAPLLNKQISSWCMRNKIPYVYQPHSHPIYSRLAFRERLMFQNREILRNARQILVINPDEVEQMEDKYGHDLGIADKSCLLPAGINVHQSIPVKRGYSADRTFHILFVGRIDDSRKGAFPLLQAFKLLLSRYHNVLLHYVGRGEGAKLKNYINQHNMQLSVMFHGEVAETTLDELYRQADLFVMPSSYEGFGMPFLEANSYGVPVIGSEVGGVKFVIKNRKTGLFSQVGNIDSIYKCMDTLISDNHLYSKCSRYGVEWANRFSWDSIVGQLEKTYTDVLKT